MKKLLLFIPAVFIYISAICQDSIQITKEKILKQLSSSSCKCIESINTINKTKDEVSKEINKCIKDQAMSYQLMVKTLGIDTMAVPIDKITNKKAVTIEVSMDENSNEYKKFYYEIERYLMSDCKALKNKIATNDQLNEKSYSDNKEAQKLYSKGQDELNVQNYKKAAEYFQQAVKADAGFAFAWDNLGLCYRHLEMFDEALAAYNKSLEIDPNGATPWQNIAVVYQYKKEYDKAIKAYEKLAEIDNTNPEVFYGMGQVYAGKLNDYEKGLDNMCKAYNLYVKQKSPYRTDAEKIIQAIYAQMKKEGKEDKFNEILKANHISSN